MGEQPQVSAPSQVVSAGAFRALVEQSSDALVVLDDQLQVRYANPTAQALLSGPSAHPTSAALLARIHPGDLARVRRAMRRVTRAPGEAPALELRLRTAEGDYRRFECLATNALDDPSLQGLVVSLRDVSENVHLVRALRTLGEGNQALVRASDEPDLLQRMCEAVVRAGGYQLAWVGYAEEDEGKTVRPVAAAGLVDYLSGLRVSWADDAYGRGPTGTAIRTGRTQVMPDIRSAAFSPWRERARKQGLRTSLVLPLGQEHQVFGALSIYSDEPGAFGPQAVGLLQELADALTYGIARLRDAARVGRSLEATIEALATMSELRDPYTAGHQCRVGALASAVATRLGLAADEVTGIRVAGDLHDVGKIVVPAEILSRPGRLSTVEWALVRCHPQAGFDIVKSIEFPWPVAQTVLQHHERLDGSGYPHGLRGDEVGIGSRVLAVADTVEAMCNHRPYRPAVGMGPARAVLVAGARTLYDPAVVDACLAVLDDGFDFDTVAGPRTADGWVVPLQRELPC